MYIEYDHPGAPEHVLAIYRRHIVHSKRKFGSARSLIHYQGFINTYLAAKREVLKTRTPRGLVVK